VQRSAAAVETGRRLKIAAAAIAATAAMLSERPPGPLSSFPTETS
jgi:hypothetical protein